MKYSDFKKFMTRIEDICEKSGIPNHKIEIGVINKDKEGFDINEVQLNVELDAEHGDQANICLEFD